MNKESEFKLNEKDKPKLALLVWFVVYMVVFSFSIIFNFSTNTALGWSAVFAGSYSIMTGYAVISGDDYIFFKKILGRLIGIFFVGFGFFILAGKIEFFNDNEDNFETKMFFVLYPFIIIVIPMILLIIGGIIYSLWDKKNDDAP